MNWKVPLSAIDLGAGEIRAVTEVLQSRWLTMGEVTGQFEREFAEFVGTKYAFAVSNGTSALHLAYASLGLGAGDDVIVPSLTFVATANAVLYTGATPVFADIVGDDDFGISPEAIERAVTPATRAVALVHYGGNICDLETVDVARRHGLAVVEDAAHAVGAELHGRRAGAIGDVACFSFFGNKNLVTGEGGMVVTSRDDLAARIRLMRSHGMTTLTWDRHRGHAQSYDVVAPGFNYRIDEVRSALGREQLKKVRANNARRREIIEQYRRRLRDVPGLSLPYLAHPGVSAGHLFPVLLDAGLNRETFMAVLKERGVQASIHYPPIHQFTYYRQMASNRRALLENTERVGRREVTLPLHPLMTCEDADYVVDAVDEASRRATITMADGRPGGHRA
jgi:dTDP-4-amino-4,6-dideoxygalactose transaminase